MTGIPTVRGHYRAIEDSRARLYRENGWYSMRPVEETVRRAASKFPGHVAVVWEDRRITYRELQEMVTSLAAGFAAAGLTAGRRVGIRMDNRPELIVALLAAMHSRCVPIPIMPTLGNREVSHVLEVANAAALLEPPAHRRARDGSRYLGPVAGYECAVTRDGVRFRQVRTGTERPSEEELGSIAVMLLSSGTTGPPKLIPREHAPFGYMIRRARELSGFDEDTTYLAALPATHGFTLDCPGVLGTLHSGGTVVLGDHRNPSRSLDLLTTEGVTHTTVVPAVAQQWLARSAEFGAPALRLVQIGGARPDVALVRRLESASGAFVQQVYGMSEGLLCFTSPDDSVETRHRTQGRPASPGDEVLVDRDGELLTRGPYTVAGYFDDPEADAKAFTPDGFYRTGDLATIDDSGAVTITGRVGDVINRGGEKVSPEELEDALRDRPGIDDVAVVGKPDPAYGEVVAVFVVCPEWSKPPLPEIRRYLRELGFAGFKLPEEIRYPVEIPKIGIGKIDRRRLRSMVEG
ncbi:AMP-binding protein [Amycolatopsis pigmentata]|uniref:AMP-binding protein n=1 Tax=Amycolatopsis pigmentata TaxID=450801 RepID=A0ABW5FPF7_9PSEU